MRHCEEEVKVYISGALTGIEKLAEVRTFYEDIAEVCREFGLVPYIPHRTTDPIGHPHIDPHSVYLIDKREASTSDLVIAYVGIESFGVGIELEIASECHIPIVLLHEDEKHLSRIVRGIPSVAAEVSFKDYNDAILQLRKLLQKYGPNKSSPNADDVLSRKEQGT